MRFDKEFVTQIIYSILALMAHILSLSTGLFIWQCNKVSFEIAERLKGWRKYLFMTNIKCVCFIFAYNGIHLKRLFCQGKLYNANLSDKVINSLGSQTICCSAGGCHSYCINPPVVSSSPSL